ncbi:hypothetical protein SAMN04487771_10684 [[Clostridium] aminophilum]|uniref:Uncharacterized protein n=1 Tax=[Clostridium] aminophilum TaxID=1526 RepID=A0A1I0I4U8_9FIRM|nr:hypothetical protein SAMN04487771_10684 [[Clostridium] aminophilum]
MPAMDVPVRQVFWTVMPESPHGIRTKKEYGFYKQASIGYNYRLDVCLYLFV